jgi:ubiquinone/menaquinone biosynthesis C-methylase UbiE
MSLFGKLFRHTKAEPSVDPEKTTTENVLPFVQDTRRYLENSDYQLPKDEEEDNRLDFQHYALFHAIGNHHVAPISPPLRTILDVGTGTGIWANEMATLFPTSIVVGLDLSVTSFKETTPENCFLRVGNVLTGLPFPDGFFSFTHQRFLVAGITGENWPRAVHELVRVTRRNGWIELVEADDQMHNAGPATLKMLEMMRAVSQRLGFDWEVVRHLGDLLVQENLQKVEMQTIRVPVGEWGGRVGSMMKRDFIAAAAAMRGRYAPLAGVTEAEFDQMVNAMAQEWEAYRSSYIFYAVYGKRSTV